jgi:predicted AAA+ superfamily ATPase
MEYYPRKIEEKMEKWLGRREYLLIRGPRQSGKTTLLLHLNELLPDSEYLTLEDPGWREALEKDPKRAAERILERKKSILLLDEAQYVKDVGQRLKLLFDLYGDRLKVIATGSGSFDIRVEVGKHLVGRAIYFELMPLTFEEFLIWRARDLHRTYLGFVESLFGFLGEGKLEAEPVFEREFQSLLEEYVIFGGFPAVVKEQSQELKRELLRNLVTTYIERDVFYFLGVRNLDRFRGLMKLLSFQIGGLLNHAGVCHELGMDFKTLLSYLSILRQTYVIDLLPPFFRNLITELRKSRKLYFLDTGLRNSMLNSFAPLAEREDRGRLLENHVFIQLRSRFEDLHFWRTTGKGEIDFILRDRDGVIPVEVKSGRGRVGRGFGSFLKSYRPGRAIVFTEGEFGVREIAGTKVAFLPHYFA